MLAAIYNPYKQPLEFGSISPKFLYKHFLLTFLQYNLKILP